jgi:serine/threonine-protein kinase
MLPELTTSQRIRLLRRAVEKGLLPPEQISPELDPASPTRSEGDLLHWFDRLRAEGKLDDAFIRTELPSMGHESPSSGPHRESTPSAGASRVPEPVPSPELETFPPLVDSRYVPLQFIGDGGMGRVFKAFDRQLNRVVALKILKRFDPETLERFIQEGRAQAGIEHPNVANVYTVGQAGEAPYLAMRFINGPTLKAALTELNLEQKLLIIRDVAEALHACHRVGIIHRDVKPTNVMLERTEGGDWRPFIMDFGLARELGAEGVTVSGVIVGTPVYCSPEQVQGHLDEVDRRSDVYSLGATLYECLTGAPPFSAVGGLVVLIQRICAEEPIPLSRRQPNIPRDLERIVGKAMEKEPARRYASAKALADDLRRFLDGDPIEARRASLAYRLAKRIQKNKALAAVVIGATVTILSLAGLGLTLILRARAQAQSAQRFGREAERMEALLFKTYSLPLHDVRRERDQVLGQLDRIREELKGQGRWSQAAGRLALGRGLAALGRFEEARTELEQAWSASSGQDPDIAQALGLVLARLYQQEMEGLRGKQREERKRDLDAQLLHPARDLLLRAKGASSNTAYIEAMLALVDERPSEALVLAREAQNQVPWFYEAWILEGDVHRFQANAHLGRGEFLQAEHALEDCGAALAHALAVGRSAPLALQAEVQRRMAVLQLRMDQSQFGQKDRDWALAAVNEALVADPEDWKALSFASAIHRRWGTVRMNVGEDPSEPLAESIRAAEEGLRFRPMDTPLLNNLGTALRYRAEWESQRGGDPRPLLAKAIEALEKALARPAFPDFLLNNLGNCHALQGTWELGHGVDPRESIRLAVACFQKAAALRAWVGHASSEASAHLDLATYLFWQGGDDTAACEAAVAAIDEALRLNPNSFLVHRNKAEIHLFRAIDRPANTARVAEDLRLAEQHFEQASGLNRGLESLVQIRKSQIEALRAGASKSPRDLARARAHLEAVARRSMDPELSLAWGEAVASLPGAPAPLVNSALTALDRALARRPWDAQLCFQKGRLLHLAGRTQEGEEALKKAEALNGNLRPFILRLNRGL